MCISDAKLNYNTHAALHQFVYGDALDSIVSHMSCIHVNNL